MPKNKSVKELFNKIDGERKKSDKAVKDFLEANKKKDIVRIKNDLASCIKKIYNDPKYQEFFGELSFKDFDGTNVITEKGIEVCEIGTNSQTCLLIMPERHGVYYTATWPIVFGGTKRPLLEYTSIKEATDAQLFQLKNEIFSSISGIFLRAIGFKSLDTNPLVPIKK